jgi:hypothetical protein
MLEYFVAPKNLPPGAFAPFALSPLNTPLNIMLQERLNHLML